MAHYYGDKATKMADRLGVSVCFYSGLEFNRKSKELADPRMPTVEHIVPRTILPLRYSLAFNRNKVVAIQVLNGMIGNAPVAVKFGLKAHLAKIEFLDNVDIDKKVEIVVQAAAAYLRAFTVQTMFSFMYCWNFAAFIDAEPRRKALEMYMGLMSEEELTFFFEKQEERNALRLMDDQQKQEFLVKAQRTAKEYSRKEMVKYA